MKRNAPGIERRGGPPGGGAHFHVPWTSTPQSPFLPFFYDWYCSLCITFVSTLCTYELSFLRSSIYVFPFLVIFMSLWFVAYSCDSFVSFLRSNTMSHASQFPLWLPQQWCLTHRKYSVNILWLISTEQNNSLRIHIKSSWAISQ